MQSPDTRRPFLFLPESLMFFYFISILFYLKHKHFPSHSLTSQKYSTRTYDIQKKLQCFNSVISANNINAKVVAKEGACLESTFMDSQQVSHPLLLLPWEVLCCPHTLPVLQSCFHFCPHTNILYYHSCQ